MIFFACAKTSLKVERRIIAAFEFTDLITTSIEEAKELSSAGDSQYVIEVTVRPLEK